MKNNMYSDNKHKIIAIIGIFLLISCALTYIVYSKVGNGELLYVADQFFKLSYDEALVNSFFKRRPENLSVQNSFVMIIGNWDLLYFLSIYKLGATIFQAQVILNILVLFFSFTLSFLGFNKFKEIIDSRISLISIFIITLWYVINPYTLVLWHGGVYNLGTMLSYALLPLALFYTHKTFLSSNKETSITMRQSIRAIKSKEFIKNVLILSLIVHLMSYTFWVFASAVVFIAIYIISYICLSGNKLQYIKSITPKLTVFGVVFSIISIYVIANIFDEFFNSSGNNNMGFTLRNFENLQGGLLYPFLMMFSWGIYTRWTPSTSYSFGEYFFTGQYILATLWLYVLTAIGTYSFYKSNKNQTKKNVLYSFIIIFFISIFLSKGAQPPFGWIYLVLFEYMPFFSVFKSPELRLGFSVIASISFLLMYASTKLNKRLFISALLVITTIQGYYFINGIATLGQNIVQDNKQIYFDRLATFSEDQKELIHFINKGYEDDKNTYGYILPVPTVEYGHFFFDARDRYIGPDLIAKHIKLPFVYPSSFGRINTATYEKIRNNLENKNLEVFNELPIRYVLLRNDAECSDCNYLSEEDFEDREDFTQILNNDTYKLYRANNSKDLVNIETNNQNTIVKFKQINPVKTLVRIENIELGKDQEIQLNYLVSFNEGWKIYNNAGKDTLYNCNTINCTTETKIIEGEELRYITSQELYADEHKIKDGYANSWTINTDEISIRSENFTMNSDGTANIEYVIYYDKQNALYLSGIVSIVSIVVSVITIFVLRKE